MPYVSMATHVTSAVTLQSNRCDGAAVASAAYEFSEFLHRLLKPS